VLDVGAPSLEKIYAGLGEALFYLINPIVIAYIGQGLDGEVFDKVYLLLPMMPEDLEDVIIDLVRSVEVVGIITFDKGVIVEPKPNPFLNPEKKRILPENMHVIQRYSFAYRRRRPCGLFGSFLWGSSLVFHHCGLITDISSIYCLVFSVGT